MLFFSRRCAMASPQALPTDIGRYIVFNLGTNSSFRFEQDTNLEESKLVISSEQGDIKSSVIRKAADKEFSKFCFDATLRGEAKSSKVATSKEVVSKFIVTVEQESPQTVKWLFPNCQQLWCTKSSGSEVAKIKLINVSNKETNIQFDNDKVTQKLVSILLEPEKTGSETVHAAETELHVETKYFEDELAVRRYKLVEGGVEFMKEYFNERGAPVDRLFTRLGLTAKNCKDAFSAKKTLEEKSRAAFKYLAAQLTFKGNDKDFVKFKKNITDICKSLNKSHINRELLIKYLN